MDFEGLTGIVTKALDLFQGRPGVDARIVSGELKISVTAGDQALTISRLRLGYGSDRSALAFFAELGVARNGIPVAADMSWILSIPLSAIRQKASAAAIARVKDGELIVTVDLANRPMLDAPAQIDPGIVEAAIEAEFGSQRPTLDEPRNRVAITAELILGFRPVPTGVTL